MLNNNLELLLKQRSFLKRLQHSAISEKVPVIGKNKGYFLELAVLLIRPLNILEIGCGNGFSSFFILKNLDNSARYTGIDMNRQRLLHARDLISSKYPGYNTEFICGNALKIIPELKNIYDFVFIDAAKFEYPLYLKLVMNNIKKGTIIIADDILCKDNIFSETPHNHFRNSVEGLTEYLRLTGALSRFNTSIIDIEGGLAVSIYEGVK